MALLDLTLPAASSKPSRLGTIFARVKERLTNRKTPEDILDARARRQAARRAVDRLL